MTYFRAILLALLLMFVFMNMFLWYSTAYSNYGKKVCPGDVYKTGDREYTMPKLPLEGNARMLSEEFRINQRNLLISVTDMFQKRNIKVWLSGGTLLGFVRHQTMMPWDDDIDVHTDWSNKEYLYSPEFGTYLEQFDLEAIYLFNSNTYMATKEGAAVRIRKLNSKTPVCDVFFVKHDYADDKYKKVNSWWNTYTVFNAVEQWDEDMLFPLQTVVIDDIKVLIPNKPQQVLKMQYGENVLNKMYARDPIISHEYPYTVLHFVWWKKSTPT